MTETTTAADAARAKAAAATVLRCLRRCGWSDERIEGVAVADLRARYAPERVMPPAVSEFYGALLVAVGND